MRTVVLCFAVVLCSSPTWGQEKKKEPSFQDFIDKVVETEARLFVAIKGRDAAKQQAIIAERKVMAKSLIGTPVVVEMGYRGNTMQNVRPSGVRVKSKGGKTPQVPVMDYTITIRPENAKGEKAEPLRVGLTIASRQAVYESIAGSATAGDKYRITGVIADCTMNGWRFIPTITAKKVERIEKVTPKVEKLDPVKP